MERSRASGLAWGIILILAGLFFLALQAFGLPNWWDPARAWPLAVVGVGAVLLIVGALTGAAGMAIPGCIVGGIGLLLYYQNATGNWESWAYAWALIPGFAGVGTILAALLGDRRSSVGAGLKAILISLVLFVIFAAFLGPLGQPGLARYWPVLLIVLGLVALVSAYVRPGGRRDAGQPRPGEKE